MKVIRVVAAVICDDMKRKSKIFATARGYGEFKGGWEKKKSMMSTGCLRIYRWLR